MIEDFNAYDGSSLEADICIIGAGAAGIAIACEFLGSRLKVIVLEGGGLAPEPDTQKLYDSEIVGHPHTSIHEGRARVLGGTTTLWGGQALRFDPFDFEERSWVPNSGWPVTRSSLDPYYDRAERVLQIGPRLSYHELCQSFRIEPHAFDSNKLYMECSRWSPKPNFGTEYRAALRQAANLTVLLHANVTEIVTNDSATAVDRVEFKSLTGKIGAAKARFYVVCSGAIDTARLLLASKRVQACGVGNQNDLVGRYFQEHIHFNFGTLVPVSRARLQDLFESFFVDGLKHAPLITLAPEVQIEKKLLSTHGMVVFDPLPDSGIVAMKTLFRTMVGRSQASAAEVRRLVGQSLASPGELFHLAYRLQVQKRAGTPKRGPIYFGGQCEMAPNPESRVMLSEMRDSLDMPRVKLDWSVGELERRTLAEYVRILAAEFERLGLGSFDLSQTGIFDSDEWVARAHDSAHHMGTARMHENPHLGVVDSQCRVHGVANLFIGGSAVFPTGARSNPTLTLLALSLRIADRLKKLAA